MTDNELFDIYTDCLISSFGLTMATGLSNRLNGVISHDRIQRFVASSPKIGKDLWLMVKPYVRQVQSSDGVMIIGILYLVTSNLELTYERITTIYQKRCNAKPYPKLLKQNTSLSKSTTHYHTK